MATLKNNYEIKEIKSELKEGEELLWQGKPQKASFVLSKSVQLLPIAIIWLAFDGFALSMIFSNTKGIPTGMLIFLCIFFAFHLLPVWMWIYSILTANKNYKMTEYVFTDKRIIAREKGILQSYYYKDLRRASVKVGLIDKMFKVGDITVSGRRSITLLDIDNPYAIGSKLQEFIDAHESEREIRPRRRNTEYEEYIENSDRDYSQYDEYDEYGDDDDYVDDYNDGDDEEFYDDARYQTKAKSNFSETANTNEYETRTQTVRFTSKFAPPKKEEKTAEDEYLDNIMDKVKKNNDEF